MKNERLLTYSGEILLGKIADSINLTETLSKYTSSEKEAQLLKKILILRTLFNESKNGLVERILPKSIFSEESYIEYVEKVYRSMDSIYDHLDGLIYNISKNAIKKYKLDLTYLIIDGTGLQIYKDKETGFVKFGYPLSGLPQIKLVLGVNKEHIPLMGKCYPGNEPDVKVFDDIITDLESKYMDIDKTIAKKYVIFDQGNVNEETINHLCKYKDKNIFFVSMVRQGTRKKFIDKVDQSEMKVVYEKEISPNNITKIHGKLLVGEVYGKKCSILVCYNPDMNKQKNETMDQNIESVRKKIVDVNKMKKPDASEVTALISKYSLKKALTVKGKAKFKLIVDEDELKKRRKYFGFFVLLSNDILIDEKMIDIYKSRNIVEEGFRVLKTDMEVTPEYHCRDDRIETHTVLVVLGYLLLSILRTVMIKEGIKYSFAELKRIILSGYLEKGYYEHAQFKEKKLSLERPKGFGGELNKIFDTVGVKMPNFEVDLVPTNSKDIKM